MLSLSRRGDGRPTRGRRAATRCGNTVKCVMEQRWVRVERDGDVRVVVLDRPDKSNAVHLPLARQLLSAVDEFDDQVRCVLIQAAGGNFCAGGDVAAFGAADDPRAYLAELAGVFHQIIRRVDRLQVPVVAAVQGGVGGAGLGLVAACDVVLCGQSARFRPAYLSLGITPDAGLSWVLPRYFGQARALDLLLNDGAFTADEAAATGFVSRVVPDDELALYARKTAQHLAAGPTTALARTRRLVRDGANRTLSAHLDAEAESIADAADHPDGREGIRAFLERRNPSF